MLTIATSRHFAYEKTVESRLAPGALDDGSAEVSARVRARRQPNGR